MRREGVIEWATASRACRRSAFGRREGQVYAALDPLRDSYLAKCRQGRPQRDFFKHCRTLPQRASKEPYPLRGEWFESVRMLRSRGRPEP